MCGVIHCKKIKNEPACKLVIKRYNKQKGRGTQGFGYVEIKNGIVIAEVRAETETEIMAKLEKSDADEIMFHHRYPTSTPNFVEATHPIKVSNKKLKYNYYVMHNGIISNDDELKELYTTQGFEYTTKITKKWMTRLNTYSLELYNDSESLAIDLALSLETGAELKSKGSIAFVALQYDKKTGQAIALYYGRNGGNPLCIENDKNFFSLSSESGKSLKKDTLYRLDYAKMEITEEPKKIGEHYADYNYILDDDYTGYNSKGKDYKWPDDFGDDAEEDDFDMYDYERQVELEDRLQRAYRDCNYDLTEELTQELDLLEQKREELWRKKKK